MKPQVLYPRGFLTPEGRPVSIATMARALRVVRANPDALYPGWDWFETTGWAILREFQRGLNERINHRGELSRDPAGYAMKYYPPTNGR